ncbi:hypothetical protein [Paraburkholderia bannensis]|uniref:hypothetical protein n=1 Tax=Paraburkholderia bannensis TaxID=765414 RepID=UPI002AB78A91|nr:hypothetical protein [Paraburkholderia bannensis]
MVRAISVLVLLAGLLRIDASALADTIRIDSGTYGENCGARHGNATGYLARRCNSSETCSFPIGLLEPMQTHGACRADFVADWTCGAAQAHRAFIRNVGTADGILVLTCVPSSGAGK